MEHSGGCGASGAGEGRSERGEEKAPVPGTFSPAGWGETEPAIVQAGARRGVHVSKPRWSWDFLSSWGQFSLSTEVGREMSGLRCLPEDAFIYGTQHCLRLLCILTGNLLYGFEGRERSPRAVSPHNPIPSKKQESRVSLSLFLRDPYITGGCCHQAAMN